MDHHPYLRLTRNQITTPTTTYTIHDLLKTLPTTKPLYLIDDDGLTTNRPHYNTYQRLTTHTDLWIDAGPRTLDDAIDLVMAGATTLILRPTLCPDLDTTNLITITDCPLYLYYNTPGTPIPPNITGFIIPNTTTATVPLSHTQRPRYLLALNPLLPIADDPAYTAAFLDLTTFTNESIK
jgi:hypothetical protein